MFNKLNYASEKSIGSSNLTKSQSESQIEDDVPSPITLSKLDSTLSEDEQNSYKLILTRIFKLYLSEKELDEASFKKIKKETQTRELVSLAINKFFDENEDKLDIFIEYF